MFSSSSFQEATQEPRAQPVRQARQEPLEPRACKVFRAKEEIKVQEVNRVRRDRKVHRALRDNQDN